MSEYALLFELYPILQYITVFVLGLCLGSFTSALTYRVPHNLPWAFEKQEYSKKLSAVRSMCPKCKTTLTGHDLMPVLSWLFTKGRCRHCQSRVSVRYPLQELLLATLGCACLHVIGFFNPLFWAIFISFPFVMAFLTALFQKKNVSVTMLIIICCIFLVIFSLF